MVVVFAAIVAVVVVFVVVLVVVVVVVDVVVVDVVVVDVEAGLMRARTFLSSGDRPVINEANCDISPAPESPKLVKIQYLLNIPNWRAR